MKFSDIKRWRMATACVCGALFLSVIICRNTHLLIIDGTMEIVVLVAASLPFILILLLKWKCPRCKRMLSLDFKDMCSKCGYMPNDTDVV